MRVTIPANDFSSGFTQRDDIFNRKKLYNQIIRVATKSPDKSLVLALDDKWGNGKTSFVKMMCSELSMNEDESLDIVYFDAFESDYQSDPFISLSSKIYSLIDKENGKANNLKKELIDAGKKVGASLLIGAAKIAVNTVTSGLISGVHLEKVKDVVSDSISSPIEDFIAERIKSGENDLKIVSEFRTVLSRLYTERDRKIIFIIDELDRARPDFALDLLEKIKHIFSVEGFVFLLVMNRVQFEKSIECRYGNIDSRLYLNKFIHYWFTLPKINHLSQGSLSKIERSTILTYLLSLDKEIEIMPRGGVLIELLSYLLEVNGCSLREAERCYSIFSIMDNPEEINGINVAVVKVAIGLITFLKVHNQKLLNDIIYKNINYDAVMSALNVSTVHLQQVKSISTLSDLINYHLSTDEELKEKRENGLLRGIESEYDEKVYILEPLNAAIEDLHISY
ncbi:KAP family P-loop NTPase fold protein [Serratia marcescens]